MKRVVYKRYSECWLFMLAYLLCYSLAVVYTVRKFILNIYCFRKCLAGVFRLECDSSLGHRLELLVSLASLIVC